MDQLNENNIAMRPIESSPQPELNPQQQLEQSIFTSQKEIGEKLRSYRDTFNQTTAGIRRILPAEPYVVVATANNPKNPDKPLELTIDQQGNWQEDTYQSIENYYQDSKIIPPVSNSALHLFALKNDTTYSLLPPEKQVQYLKTNRVTLLQALDTKLKEIIKGVKEGKAVQHRPFSNVVEPKPGIRYH